MKTGVLAFCGAKFSGKSTSAEIFTRLFKGATEEIAFAGHLKKTCSKVFKIDMKYFLDPALKEVEMDSYVHLTKWNIQQVFEEFHIKKFDYDTHIRQHVGQVFDTPRKLLQYIGTEVLHPLDSLIHVNITMKLKDKNKLSVVTDLRFPQEFNSLEPLPEFVGVYVSNLAAENKAATDGHASEKGYLQFRDRCYRVDNNGTVQELEANIKQLIKDKFGV